MAKKDIENKRRRDDRDERNYDKRDKRTRIKNETTRSIVAIILFFISAVLLFAAFGKSGEVGRGLYGFLRPLFGFGYFLIPLLFVAAGISFLKNSEQRLSVVKALAALIFFLSGLAILEIGNPGAGGSAGAVVLAPLVTLFDIYSSVLFLFALIIISLLIIFDTHIKSEWLALMRRRERRIEEEEEAAPLVVRGADLIEKKSAKPEEVKQEEAEPMVQESQPVQKKKEVKEEEFSLKELHRTNFRAYVPPPLSLLETDKGKPGVGDIKANANIIKRTLQNFGIVVEMDEITIGPTVTRYALKPAEGVKLSKIVGLQDNLALALAAQSIRIEAPIPGKSLVGIEVPNSSKTTVGLGSMIGSDDFEKSPKPLFTSIGKNVSGNPVFYDLAKMPHLLIAGTTGSGKSVAVHAILTSLLYRNSPDMLKFIMVDAKRVELTLYNKIPHLLTPVITEAKKTILALKWAAKEMDRRYDLLEKESVRDIYSYHKNILEPALKNPKEGAALPETMPYIVIVVDELADLMQSYPRELESAIVRLAQMSRAVGIHLVLSTQRPSVNVITGLIKANIPTRMALKVQSQIDSRTILDRAGAEKLVGQGDMLFSSQDAPEPVRIQGPYISENEVKKVVKYLADNFADEVPGTVSSITDEKSIEEGPNPIFDSSVLADRGDEDDDDLYEDAKAAVIQAGKASTSYIQRKLRVGYARAARLMDILESRGVIGPADGSKPREVLTGGGQSDSSVEEEVF